MKSLWTDTKKQELKQRDRFSNALNQHKEKVKEDINCSMMEDEMQQKRILIIYIHRGSKYKTTY